MAADEVPPKKATDTNPPKSANAHPTRSEDEVVFESSVESFPASDPPSWVFGRDNEPPPRSIEASRLRQGLGRVPLHILERALSRLRQIRKGGEGKRP